MTRIEAHTQAQLDDALKNLKAGDWIVCLGGTRYKPMIVRGSSHVEAFGSSHVVARGSSHVEAWDSSHVEAWESSHVVAWGSSHVVAARAVAVHKMPSHMKKISGGVVIDVPDPHTFSVKDWCDYYGVPVKRGSATLFKAVDEDLSTFQARRAGISYTIGTSPLAPDFNIVKECGGGLHVSPSPAMALAYHSSATPRFLRVTARLSDLVVVGDKVKARTVRVVGEVDRYGKPVEREAT